MNTELEKRVEQLENQVYSNKNQSKEEGYLKNKIRDLKQEIDSISSDLETLEKRTKRLKSEEDIAEDIKSSSKKIQRRQENLISKIEDKEKQLNDTFSRMKKETDELMEDLDRKEERISENIYSVENKSDFIFETLVDLYIPEEAMDILSSCLDEGNTEVLRSWIKFAEEVDRKLEYDYAQEIKPSSNFELFKAFYIVEKLSQEEYGEFARKNRDISLQDVKGIARRFKTETKYLEKVEDAVIEGKQLSTKDLPKMMDILICCELQSSNHIDEKFNEVIEHG